MAVGLAPGPAPSTSVCRGGGDASEVVAYALGDESAPQHGLPAVVHGPVDEVVGVSALAEFALPAAPGPRWTAF